MACITDNNFKRYNNETVKIFFYSLYLVFAIICSNFNIINQNNIEVNKLEMGYHIYIQKNSETAGLKLKYKLEDGSYSYLYANNSLININNTSVHDNLGYVFETYLPETYIYIITFKLNHKTGSKYHFKNRSLSTCFS